MALRFIHIVQLSKEYSAQVKKEIEGICGVDGSNSVCNLAMEMKKNVLFEAIYTIAIACAEITDLNVKFMA